MIKKTHCGCGFPIPPVPRTFKEGFTIKQVLVKHKIKCKKCGKENIVVG